MAAPEDVRERTGTREKPRAVSVRELRSLDSAFFAGLETADLAALGGVMFQRSYPAGQIVLLEGQDVQTPRLTQELLAAMAGSRREVVGRALKALSQEGAVRLERGRIHVCDRKALEQLAWM